MSHELSYMVKNPSVTLMYSNHPVQPHQPVPYSYGDGFKPMKLPYDWGNMNPLTSYFRVPSGYQGFDP
jgi:hypothetical protein